MATYSGNATSVVNGATFVADITGIGTDIEVRLNGVVPPIGTAGGAAEARENLYDLLFDGDDVAYSLTFTDDFQLLSPGSGTVYLFWVTRGTINVSVQMATDGYVKFAGTIEHAIGTINVVDIYGNNLYSEAVYDAASEAELNLTGLWATIWKDELKIKSCYPGSDAVNVPIDTTIKIVFNQDVLSSSLYQNDDEEEVLNSISIRLFNANGNQVTSETSVVANIVTITPSIPLSTETSYIVKVNGSDGASPFVVTNRLDDKLAVSYGSIFTTGTNVLLDITDDEAASVAAGGVIYRPSPFVQRALTIKATSPANYSSNLSSLPTLVIRFSDSLTEDSAEDYPFDEAGTVVECYKSGIFSSSLTSVTATPEVDANGNMTIDWGEGAAISDNTKYLLIVSRDTQSINGVTMEEDYEYVFTGPYDPLYIEADRVKMEMGSIADEIKEDLINRFIHRHCLDLYNRFTTAITGTEYWIQELVSYKVQKDLLEVALMNKDAGSSVTLGIMFTERTSGQIHEMITRRLTQLSKNIRALVNTYIHDFDADLAKSMLLADGLVGDMFDRVSWNTFYKSPGLDRASISFNRGISLRGTRTGNLNGGGIGMSGYSRESINGLWIVETFLRPRPLG